MHTYVDSMHLHVNAVYAVFLLIKNTKVSVRKNFVVLLTKQEWVVALL
jgi:hypothetical protein